jgi:aminoglycoside phosphotransferase
MASTRVTLMKSALKTMHALNIHSDDAPFVRRLGHDPDAAPRSTSG